MNRTVTRKPKRTTMLKGSPAPAGTRRPVVKVYGKKSKYMPEGASVYERARALRKAARI